MRRGEEIRAVRASGLCVRGERFTLYIAASPTYRIGIISGRRVGIAAQRNRARRLLREAMRHIRPRLRADRGAALLVAARPEILAASAGDVLRELETLLSRHDLMG